MILADETSQFYMGGFMQMIVPEVSMAPKLMESFRTGRGLPQSEYPPEVFEAIERGSAPIYRHQLSAQMDSCDARSRSSAQAGRPSPWTSAVAADAPLSLSPTPFLIREFHGYDAHPGSVERARANAATAGLAERSSFDVVDCTKLPASKFDFITAFDVIHDSVDPVGLLKSIRQALKPDGAFLMVEVNVSNQLEDNLNPMGRMMYSVSTLYCMTVSLAHGGAGIGALMGEPKARELATEAGFSKFTRLPVKDAFSVLYELRP